MPSVNNYALLSLYIMIATVLIVFKEVTGERVNRKAGYGLEILCVYRLYGTKAYVDRIKKYNRLHDVLWTYLVTSLL